MKLSEKLQSIFSFRTGFLGSFACGNLETLSVKTLVWISWFRENFSTCWLCGRQDVNSDMNPSSLAGKLRQSSFFW